MKEPAPSITGECCIQVPALAAIPWLRHGFSTRRQGTSTVYGQPDDLNLGFTPDDERDNVIANRNRLISSVTRQYSSRPAWPLATIRQIHSTHIVAVEAETMESPSEGDALITRTPGRLIGILTADCVPVLLVDTRQRIVSVLHAGWRGTVGAIAAHGAAALERQLGSKPADLLAVIGPSIGPCCYTVGDEVRRAFQTKFDYADDLFQADRLDLWAANRRQLLAAGLRPSAVTTLGLCTVCTRSAGQPLFFSHRAERGRTGRMMTVAGIADGDNTSAESL